ncbi:MAG: ABC transporter permease, partial [Bacteroidia bacterium]
MFKNYLIIAYRNLLKDKVSSFINIFCLAIGMGCCMLIITYIKDELSYNQFNTDYNNIYRIDLVTDSNGEPKTGAGTPIIYAPTFTAEVPQIKHMARMYQRSGSISSETAGKKFQEQRVFFSDNDLFSIFSIHFLQGNKEALGSMNSIVLSSGMALKYFGSTNVIGKTLLYENKVPLKITGVTEPLPANSDLQFDFLVSFENLYAAENADIVNFLKTDWLYSPVITFCLINPGQDISGIEKQLNVVLKKHGDARSREVTSVKIRALKDIHLYSADVQGNPSNSSIAYVYIFGAIALLILIIANVNFVNLATARASTRAREVGIRKVLGAARAQLIGQFLGEALVLSCIAFFIALLLTNLALPSVNQLTNKQFGFSTLTTGSNLAQFGFLFFSTGILAGLYPAFFISKFRTVQSLKGKSGERNKRNYLRKSLMISQFSISTILIISAIIIYQQLHYLRNKPLGFQKEQVINVPIFGRGASILTYGVDIEMRKRMNAFSNELTKFSKVTAVTAASELPGQGFTPGLVIPEGAKETDNIFAPWISVDYNFLSVLKIPLIAGRDFSKSTGTDHLQAFIISEAAAKQFGWNPKTAIGKSFIRGDAQNGKKGRIIGVIRDFNFNTLDQPMQPVVMDVSVARFTQFAITIQPDHVPQTLDYIRQKWDAFFPERVFEYSFLDSDINALYKHKENLAGIIQYFAIIAIVLSCLGLFSLASFLSIQRTREIGIR